jgi:uridine kinase
MTMVMTMPDTNLLLSLLYRMLHCTALLCYNAMTLSLLLILLVTGKTTVAEKIIERIKSHNPRAKVINLSLDRFYRTCTEEELANIQQVNFDHVNRFDWELFRKCLQELSLTHHEEGDADSAKVAVPRYSFTTHRRENECDYLQPSHVIIVEGMFILFDEDIRKMLDLKIFVDTDLDECLARRIKRDIDERGRTIDSVIYQWFDTVKPGFESFIFPSRRYADVVVPHGGETINHIAINLIAQHIQHRLESIAQK